MRSKAAADRNTADGSPPGTEEDGVWRVPDGPVGVAVLGSTGSVGTQTLDVIAHHPDRFRVVALVAGRNTARLAEQAAQFRPELIGADPSAPAVSGLGDRVLPADEALLAAATLPSAEIVVVATTGHAAILPTFHAIQAGKTVALANKETIVCAGELVMAEARARGVAVRPVDSEHSAIWQALGRAGTDEVTRLILTASGGPFRETPADALARVTVAEALAHPTWSMGGKITVDSATLMNKGLEVIEARWLFDLPLDRIEVLVHPESIVHSLVEFADASQIAQLSLPDMRLPIQYALTWPEHAASPCRRLDLAAVGTLRFAPPDPIRFPALRLAREAGEAGRTFPTVLSAADEVAVDAFLSGRLGFVGIADLVARILELHRPDGPLSFASIAEADVWARRTAKTLLPGSTG